MYKNPKKRKRMDLKVIMEVRKKVMKKMVLEMRKMKKKEVKVRMEAILRMKKETFILI